MGGLGPGSWANQSMATRGYIGETLEFLDQIMRERKMARDHVEGAMACMGWAGPLGATPGRGRGSDNSSERVESSPGRRRAVARDKTAEDGRGLIKSAEARQGPACSLLLETRVDENGVSLN